MAETLTYRQENVLGQNSNPLFKEVIRAKSGFDEFYKLEGTGFNIGLQANQFTADIKKGAEDGMDFDRVLDGAFSKIEQDIQGFKTEYLCEGLLFPIVLNKKNVDGRVRVVAPLYDDKLLVDTTTEQERNGAVKKSLQKIENFLVDAKPGSIAVMISPPGWSGFDGINYEDTQTYIFQVRKDGTLRGFAVRTDMDINDNKNLLVALGKSREEVEKGSEVDDVVGIVSSPVLIEGGKGKDWEIEEVVKVIEYVKGSDVAYKSKRFSEIYKLLENPEHLWTLDSKTQKLVDGLKDFTRAKFADGSLTRQDFEIALGLTVLKLAHIVRGGSDSISNETNAMPMRHKQDIPYHVILQDMQSLPGCNGGGRALFDSVTPRWTTNGSMREWFNCPKCQYRADGPIGNICPGCFTTKEQFVSEAKESGQEVCD